MLQIHKIGIIGLGALGVMYGDALQRAFGQENVFFIADPVRAARYAQESVLLNGKPCAFRYVADNTCGEHADLLLVTVKYTGLPAAIESVRNFVGPDTVIISALNGVVSEKEIAAVYGAQHLLYCTVQGMDATKHQNAVVCRNTGYFALGLPGGGTDDKLHAACAVLDRAGLSYQLPQDILKQLWNKFMFNVGINQVTAAHGTTYREVQHPGPLRDEMCAAMREAQQIAAREGVMLTDGDIAKWLALTDSLDPDGMTSMRQDVLHGRPTELALFAGTVLRLGQVYGVPTPVNNALFKKIRALEEANNGLGDQGT